MENQRSTMATQEKLPKLASRRRSARMRVRPLPVKMLKRHFWLFLLASILFLGMWMMYTNLTTPSNGNPINQRYNSWIELGKALAHKNIPAMDPNVEFYKPAQSNDLLKRFEGKSWNHSVPWKPELKGKVNLHVFEDWCGSTIKQLRRNLHFPLYPHTRTTVDKLAVTPQWTNYGLRIFGYLHPVTDGDFQFAVSSDDNSEFWLSDDETVGKLKLLCKVGPPGNHWTVPGEFDKFQSQSSQFVRLSASQRYYFELLHKQDDTGTDHVEIGWRLAEVGARFTLIDSQFLSLYSNDSQVPLGNTSLIPLTEASHPTICTEPHQADMLKPDPRDDFYKVPFLAMKRLRSVLPSCPYNPSYLVSGYPLQRYQGLQFVHLAYVYPNDYTRLSHMEKENHCIYQEPSKYINKYTYRRYMKLENPEPRADMIPGDGEDYNQSDFQYEDGQANDVDEDRADSRDNDALMRHRKLFGILQKHNVSDTRHVKSQYYRNVYSTESYQKLTGSPQTEAKVKHGLQDITKNSNNQATSQGQIINYAANHKSRLRRSSHITPLDINTVPLNDNKMTDLKQDAINGHEQQWHKRNQSRQDYSSEIRQEDTHFPQGEEQLRARFNEKWPVHQLSREGSQESHTTVGRMMEFNSGKVRKITQVSKREQNLGPQQDVSWELKPDNVQKAGKRKRYNRDERGRLQSLQGRNKTEQGMERRKEPKLQYEYRKGYVQDKKESQRLGQVEGEKQMPAHGEKGKQELLQSDVVRLSNEPAKRMRQIDGEREMLSQDREILESIRKEQGQSRRQGLEHDERERKGPEQGESRRQNHDQRRRKSGGDEKHEYEQVEREREGFMQDIGEIKMRDQGEELAKGLGQNGGSKKRFEQGEIGQQRPKLSRGERQKFGNVERGEDEMQRLEQNGEAMQDTGQGDNGRRIAEQSYIRMPGQENNRNARQGSKDEEKIYNIPVRDKHSENEIEMEHYQEENEGDEYEDGNEEEELEFPLIYEQPVVWNKTFRVGRTDFQIMRSDMIDLQCNTSGNLLLRGNEALIITRAFMKKLNQKYRGVYILQRIINVEKHLDYVRGSRYLLELELKDRSNRILRFSQYVYTSSWHLLSPEDRDNEREMRNMMWSSQRRLMKAEEQIELCWPSGLVWNPQATVHFIVPVKNQARWVQKFIWDMEDLYRTTSDSRFNVIIVDFNSTDLDIKSTLRHSHIPSFEFVSMEGNFERSAGLQAGINLVRNPHSILFLCDLHMQFPSSIIDSVRMHTVEGKMVFAPMVMRLNCGASPCWPEGYWEVNGFGLLGIYKSDLDNIGGMNTAEFRDRWGGEDWELLDRIVQAGLEVERVAVRNFYHHYHSKRGMWNRREAPSGR
ncbi:beta-1,4-N-acetylgalactosaminyltransferase 3 [Pelobates fuscus]|uniref:beta-1,4-N-acetylgalactosaminyltransferase 3 n=1 Tax=Pelobates fuscus TaxID=191477 RepID=UPI002FE48347